jgi:hypothetical protein
LDNVDLSRDVAVRGFLGKNQAVTIVVRDETRGPFILYGEGADGGACGIGEQETARKHKDTKAKKPIGGCKSRVVAFLNILN